MSPGRLAAPALPYGMLFMAALLAASSLLPAPARAGTYSAADNPQSGDKEKQLPKPEIEKHQDELKNDQRFDAYRQAVGAKSDQLKGRIDACKTKACFDSVGKDLGAAKQADFSKTEPNAPLWAGATDAGRDRYYQDGAAKMGRVSLAALPSAARPAPGLGTPVISPQTLKESQPVIDLKQGRGLTPGGPLSSAAALSEQSAAAGPKTVGRGSPRSDVAKAQGELNAYRRLLGEEPLKLDGLYGPKTTQAAKDVQRALDLDRTGRFDAQTRAALAKGLSAAPESVGRDSPRIDVAKAQNELNARRLPLGLEPLKLDGLYGPKTTQAVKDVQRALGLERTGVFDAKTREALGKALPATPPPGSTYDGHWAALERRLAQTNPNIPRAALEKAFRYLDTHDVRNRRFLTIIDMDRPNSERRMHIIDLRTGKVEDYLAAHGKGSGVLYATHFSDRVNSHQTSLGIYETGDEYQGGKGRSLQLNGMEETNRSAAGRAIVLHGSNYVSDAYLRANGRIGDSWGCPAIDFKYRDHIIDEIGNDSVMLIYHE